MLGTESSTFLASSHLILSSVLWPMERHSYCHSLLTLEGAQAQGDCHLLEALILCHVGLPPHLCSHTEGLTVLEDL